MKRIYSTGEAARLLGVPVHRISYAHASGKVKEPARVFGKRAYSENDLAALAKFFGVKGVRP